MKKLLLTLLLSVSTSAIADEFYWRLADGSIAPNVANRKAIDNFGGWLLITPDPDWENKWNQNHTIPKFTEAKQIQRGESVTILPFFANPKLDKNSNFLVLCDIKLIRPDGSLSINKANIPCAQGKLATSPQQMFLTRTVIQFIGEVKDQLGEWKVEFNMKDPQRGVSLPLETSFELINNLN